MRGERIGARLFEETDRFVRALCKIRHGFVENPENCRNHTCASLAAKRNSDTNYDPSSRCVTRLKDKPGCGFGVTDSDLSDPYGFERFKMFLFSNIDRKERPMTRISIGIAAVASMLASSAFAVDLAPRPYTKAPVIPVVICDWTGFYIGGNAGYSWGREKTDGNLTGTQSVSEFRTAGPTCWRVSRSSPLLPHRL
jgi:hypothetical protein